MRADWKSEAETLVPERQDGPHFPLHLYGARQRDGDQVTFIHSESNLRVPVLAAPR